MKKFLPLVLFALLCSASASAQKLRWGITGAMNFGDYSMKVDDISVDPSSRVGFRAGVRMEMEAPFIYDGFYFDGELALSAKGAKLDFSTDDEVMKVRYTSAIAICSGRVRWACLARLVPTLVLVCLERTRLRWAM